MDRFRREIRDKLSFIAYAPYFISAKRTKSTSTMELVKFVSNQHTMRISTGMINEVIGEAVLLNQPHRTRGRD